MEPTTLFPGSASPFIFNAPIRGPLHPTGAITRPSVTVIPPPTEAEQLDTLDNLIAQAEIDAQNAKDPATQLQLIDSIVADEALRKEQFISRVLDYMNAQAFVYERDKRGPWWAAYVHSTEGPMRRPLEDRLRAGNIVGLIDLLGVGEIMDMWDAGAAYERIMSGKERPGDLATVASMLAPMILRERLGKSWSDTALDIGANIVPTAMVMATTLGLGGLVREAGASAAKNLAMRAGLGVGARRAAGIIGEAAVYPLAYPAATGSLAVREAVRRQMPAEIGGEGEDTLTAIERGVESAAIELVSEGLGGLISSRFVPGLRRLSTAARKSARDALTEASPKVFHRAAAALHSARERLATVGLHSPLSEIAEEYASGYGHDIAGLQDFDGFTLQELSAMAAAFAAPGPAVALARGTGRSLGDVVVELTARAAGVTSPMQMRKFTKELSALEAAYEAEAKRLTDEAALAALDRKFEADRAALARKYKIDPSAFTPLPSREEWTDEKAQALFAEFSAVSDAHKKFAEDLNSKYVDTGILEPYQRDIILTLLKGANPENLGKLRLRPAPDFLKLSLKFFGAYYDSPGSTRELEVTNMGRVTPENLEPTDINNLYGPWGPQPQSFHTFWHELGHFTSMAFFTPKEWELVERIMNERPSWFWGGLFVSSNPTIATQSIKHASTYYQSNKFEFVAESFANWVLARKLTDPKLMPLFRRLMDQYADIAAGLRDSPAHVDLLAPMYERMLALEVQTEASIAATERSIQAVLDSTPEAQEHMREAINNYSKAQNALMRTFQERVREASRDKKIEENENNSAYREAERLHEAGQLSDENFMAARLEWERKNQEIQERYKAKWRAHAKTLAADMAQIRREVANLYRLAEPKMTPDAAARVDQARAWFASMRADAEDRLRRGAIHYTVYERLMKKYREIYRTRLGEALRDLPNPSAKLREINERRARALAEIQPIETDPELDSLDFVRLSDMYQSAMRDLKNLRASDPDAAAALAREVERYERALGRQLADKYSSTAAILIEEVARGLPSQQVEKRLTAAMERARAALADKAKAEEIEERYIREIEEAQAFRSMAPAQSGSEKGTSAEDELDPPITIEPPAPRLPWLFRKLVPLQNLALWTGDKRIIGIAEQILMLMGRRMETEHLLLAQARTQMHKIRKWMKNAANAKTFVKIMDETHTPDDIRNMASLPEDVREVLVWFKTKAEHQRKFILHTLRRRSAKAYASMPKEWLEKALTNAGIIHLVPANWTKKQAAKALAAYEYPDDWGKQWGYMPHIFFGEYILAYYSGGKRYVFGSANNPADARFKIQAFLEKQKALGNPIPIKSIEARPKVYLPTDVLRLSGTQYGRLIGQIEAAVGVESAQVRNWLRGVIGTKSGRRPFFAALMHRKGAEGWSEDFMRVWETNTRAFVRWAFLSRLVETTQGKIDRLRGDRPDWAEYLENTINDAFGRRLDTGLVGDVDQLVYKALSIVPGLARYLQPGLLHRTLRRMRTAMYFMQLQTPKFMLVNRSQILTDLWPVIGEKNLIAGLAWRYSAEGRRFLSKYQPKAVAGKLLEEDQAHYGEKILRSLPAAVSEGWNQADTFAVMYWLAHHKNGLPHETALRVAYLRGLLLTQFSYNPANTPEFLRGQVAKTMFQYQRFTTHHLSLAALLLKHGGAKLTGVGGTSPYGGAARWLLAHILIGGLASTPLSHPAVMAALSSAIVRAVGDDNEWLALAVTNGLPAAVGMDISGSIMMMHYPWGEEDPIMALWDMVGGPVPDYARRVIMALSSHYMGTRPEAYTYGPLEIVAAETIQAMPTLKSLVEGVDLLNGDMAVRDSMGRLRYEATVSEKLIKALGGRPSRETSMQLGLVEAALLIDREIERQADRIATLIADQQPRQAALEWRGWNATNPDMPITRDMVKSRVITIFQGRNIPQLERRIEGMGSSVQTGAYRRGGNPHLRGAAENVLRRRMGRRLRRNKISDGGLNSDLD